MSGDMRTPRRFEVLALVAFLGALSVFASTPPGSWREFSLLTLALTVVATVSENYAPIIGGYSISLALPMTAAALLLQGPHSAALVAAVSALGPRSIRDTRGAWITLYNLGQLVLVSMAAGSMYLVAGGRILTEADGSLVPLQRMDFPEILLPLALAALACAVGNMIFTATGVAVLYGRRLSSVIGESLTYVPSLIALAVVGFLIADVVASSALSLIFFVFPLIVARDLYQRSSALRSAFADTVRTLVDALEAKDPYTRGHSERVAAYATATALQMGFDAASVERFEYAALLHDIGKIAVSDGLLTKPGSLTEAERRLMERHPADGAEMVARIPILAELAACVLQHHERFDGGGYPFGLRGDEVSRLARILAVADAYDAMTSDRSYRKAMSPTQALERLRSAEGSQFDPSAVQAFVEAVLPCHSINVQEMQTSDDLVLRQQAASL